jgi:hypothetical protein
MSGEKEYEPQKEKKEKLWFSWFKLPILVCDEFERVIFRWWWHLKTADHQHRLGDEGPWRVLRRPIEIALDTARWPHGTNIVLLLRHIRRGGERCEGFC